MDTGVSQKVEIKGRVLFTGSGGLVIDDLMRLISKEYQSKKCPPVDPDFSASLKQFSPHAVVICLADESRETLRLFASIAEIPEFKNLPMITIGNEEDCSVFKRNVFQKKLQIFVRPLDAERFIETLNQYLADEIAEVRKNMPEPAAVQTTPAADPADSQND